MTEGPQNLNRPFGHAHVLWWSSEVHPESPNQERVFHGKGMSHLPCGPETGMCAGQVMLAPSFRGSWNGGVPELCIFRQFRSWDSGNWELGSGVRVRSLGLDP